MLKTTNRTISRLAAALLMLIIVVEVLPTGALAANASQPDWYFLFAIFKNVDADCKDINGKTAHQKYTMARDEINYFKENAQGFETYMNSTGVMSAHVDVVEIDTPVTDLNEYDGGSYLGAEQVKPLLDGKVELDRYDHVSCIVSLNTYTRYGGISSPAFENGTGISCMNFINWEYCRNSIIPREKKFPVQVYVHEFLHLMESQSKKFGAEFDLHGIVENLYKSRDDNGKTCYTDVILNRVEGNAETGTGVHSAAWQYPPHILRTIDELTIPDGVTGIGARAFQYKSNLKRVTLSDSVTSVGKYAFYQSGLESVNIPRSMTSIEANAFCGAGNLKSVTIPSSVTSIGGSAFNGCSSLKSVTIPNRVTSIEAWTFANCNGLEKVSIPASVTSIGDVAFYGCNTLQDIYYGGTETQWKAIKIGASNAALTRAKIHYNRGQQR